MLYISSHTVGENEPLGDVALATNHFIIKRKPMKKIIFFLAFGCCFLLSGSVFGQESRNPLSANEIEFITTAFATMSESDQRYRGFLTYNTLDTMVIARIDSVMEGEGVAAGFKYVKSLGLTLSKATEDSLWTLQHQLDFQNHLMMRGIWELYGYIPEEVVEEKNYIQILLLVHPQKDWDIPTYHQEYAAFLRPEVEAGRMPAKEYATFYDNILCKIMRKPQLYGTNEQFSSAEGKVLPPVIEDLDKSNAARAELGMAALKEGEFRLAE